MPELPEVETIRRQLSARIVGRTIVQARVLDSLWCQPAEPASVEYALAGGEITGLERRGKYLIMLLDAGRRLVMHLRMTGNLLWEASSRTPDPSHTRVRIELDDKSILRFVDVRRFGTGRLFSTAGEVGAYFEDRLGPEPLEDAFSAQALSRQVAGRRTPIKALLLDQRRIAGVGNIYADEALFRARIHPLRPAGRLRRAEIERLHAAIVKALETGVAAQGASIDDYRHLDGERGTMQDEFLVHLREGRPCLRCGRPIKKMRAAGRGTYVCTRCQPAPRSRRARA